MGVSLGEPEAYTAEAPQRSLPLVDLTCVSADGGEGSKWDELNKEFASRDDNPVCIVSNSTVTHLATTLRRSHDKCSKWEQVA